MNILITGGAGFIGSSLTERLIKDKKNFVVVVDNLSTGNINKLPPLQDNYKFIHCDVNNYHDMAEIMVTFRFQFVFHYAAVVGVQRTLSNPLSVLNDIKGIQNIVELSRKTAVNRVFFSSSSEIYGDPVETPQREDTTPLNTRLPYAIVKNVGEAYLQTFKREYNLNYTIFRLFNTYGPKQSKDFVISKFINNALNNEDLSIYGDGMQTRTFCFIDDNIDACLSAAFENKYINEIINIGSDAEISILELAKMIIHLTKSSSRIAHLPPLEMGDMRSRKPDVSKMKNLLNHTPMTLEQGIKKILKSGLFSNGS